MARAKAGVQPHIAPHTVDCPMSERAVEEQFDACLRDSKAFSQGVLGFLAKRPAGSQAKWAQESVEAGRVIFQPWSMEILFVLAVARKARFTQLQEMLGGISSRTLSDKLQNLRGEGLVEREVHDEQPVRIGKPQLAERTEGPEAAGVRRTSVRIEYALTQEGRRTAALATPLFAHLNHRKM